MYFAQQQDIAKYEKNPTLSSMLFKQHAVSNDPFSHQKKRDNSSMNMQAMSLKTIGVLSIPKLHEELPVYDGTSDMALDRGVGLFSGKPMGGKNNRIVLAGHSGRTVTTQFTNLHEMDKKDMFYFKVGKEIHAYKVVEIKRVLPDDIRAVVPKEGQDLATLLTCTISDGNQHRLLVTGKRVAYNGETFNQTWQPTPLLWSIIGAVSGVIIIIVVYKRHQSSKKEEQNEPR